MALRGVGRAGGHKALASRPTLPLQPLTRTSRQAQPLPVTRLCTVHQAVHCSGLASERQKIHEEALTMVGRYTHRNTRSVLAGGPGSPGAVQFPELQGAGLSDCRSVGQALPPHQTHPASYPPSLEPLLCSYPRASPAGSRPSVPHGPASHSPPLLAACIPQQAPRHGPEPLVEPEPSGPCRPCPLRCPLPGLLMLALSLSRTTAAFPFFTSRLRCHLLTLSR